MRVDRGVARDLVGIVRMVRDRMVGFRHANLRIGAPAELARHHERDDPRQVALVGQHLQIEHQLRVFFVGRRNAGRLLDQRQFPLALLLGRLNPPLGVANRFQIFLKLGTIGGAEAALEPEDPFGHRVQDVAILLEPRLTRRRIGRAAIAEQALEDHARVVLHRQRRRRTSPGDRAGVGAAVAAIARPRQNRWRRAPARARRAGCARPTPWPPPGPSRFPPGSRCRSRPRCLLSAARRSGTGCWRARGPCRRRFSPRSSRRSRPADRETAPAP